ncbi:MAG: PaaI family thioesterase [Alphaproteobacteria bacterium]|nr:PaaI family thioesterase [Alphaproteobacteria bacterium]
MTDTNAPSEGERPPLAYLQFDPQGWLDAIPHGRALGIRCTGIEEGRARLEMPYRADLVGDPETGVLHGGVITTLLDTVSGLAALSALDRLRSMATLDLRIDYMRPASPEETVFAEAHCYRLTRSVAFVRGLAHHGDPEAPIAASSASFMLDTGSARKARAGETPS